MYTHMTFALIGMHLITMSIEYPLDVTLSLPIIIHVDVSPTVLYTKEYFGGGGGGGGGADPLPTALDYQTSF